MRQIIAEMAECMPKEDPDKGRLLNTCRYSLHFLEKQYIHRKF